MLFLRIFIPSWRFFDQVGSFVKLQYRTKDSDWKNALEKPKPSFFSIFFNPQENLRLYYYSIVSRFISEPENQSIELLKQIVHEELNQATAYQFQILAITPTNNLEYEVVYQSDWINSNE